MVFRQVRRRAGAVALFGVFALTLAACAGAGSGGGESPDGDAGEPQTGGSAVVASLTETPGFDPVRLVAAGSGIERGAAVMDTLMYRNDVTDEVTPKLAKSLESDDAQVWVLMLREGINFTDGTPLDADAVVFNLERHIAPDSTSSAKSLLSGVETIEATGDLEVTITLDKPSGSFPLALTGTSSASMIGSPKALADPEAFNAAPVGAGPFVFESWVRDSELKVVRNDDYWQEGMPYLDEVTFRVIPDTQGRFDALTSGGVVHTAVSGTSWAGVEANPELTIMPSPQGGQPLIPNATKAPTDDERIRRAIGLSTDPKVTNTIVFPGSNLWNMNRDCLPFPEGSDACLEGAAPTPNVEEAKKLVAEYVAEGGDPTIDYLVINSSDETAYYQSQMAMIGLDVKLRVAGYGTYLEDANSGNYGVMYGVAGSSGYPTQFRYMYSGGRHWGQGDHPDLDEALLRARDELKLEDRNAAWRDVAAIVKDESILFWQAPFTNASAFSNKLHLGSDEYPYFGSLMVYFDDAWLEQ